MILNIMIAALLTFMIYIIVGLVKSVRQFLIFKQVRETILLSAFSYLKQTPDRMVDLNYLHTLLMKKLKEIKMVKWVNDLKITWQSNDAIQFVFELKFNDLNPKYKFVIGLKDVKDVLEKRS